MTKATKGTGGSGTNDRWGLPHSRTGRFRRRIGRAIGGGADKEDQGDQGLRAAAATAGASGRAVAVAGVGVEENGGAFREGAGGKGGRGRSGMGFEVSFSCRWWPSVWFQVLAARSRLRGDGDRWV